MSACYQIDMSAPRTSPKANASRWARFSVWLYGAPLPKPVPYVGPGHCAVLANHFGHGLIPPRPVPRDCSAMVRKVAKLVPVPDHSSDMPWTLLRSSLASETSETVVGATIAPHHAQPSTRLFLQDYVATSTTEPAAETGPDMSIADLMQRLVVALETDPIPASAILTQDILPLNYDFATRLAVVSKRNKPQKKNRAKARRQLAMHTPKRSSITAAANPIVSAFKPAPKSMTAIDALVADAASNVVRLIGDGAKPVDKVALRTQAA